MFIFTDHYGIIFLRHSLIYNPLTGIHLVKTYAFWLIPVEENCVATVAKLRFSVRRFDLRTFLLPIITNHKEILLWMIL